MDFHVIDASVNPFTVRLFEQLTLTVSPEGNTGAEIAVIAGVNFDLNCVLSGTRRNGSPRIEAKEEEKTHGKHDDNQTNTPRDRH